MPTMVRISVLFWLGASLIHMLPVLLGWHSVICLVVAGALTFRTRAFPWLCPLIGGLLLANTVAGFMLMRTLPSSVYEKPVIITGWVTGLPNESDAVLRFDFLTQRIRFPTSELAITRRLRLSWYGDTPRVRPGERWRLEVRLRSPRSYRNWGIVDFEKRSFIHGIKGRGYVRVSTDNARLGLSGSVALLDQIRWGLAQSLVADRPKSTAMGVIRALAVGDRSAIQPEEWRVLRRTGLSHLIAISGLHIGLAATLGYWLFNVLWRLSPALLLRVPAQTVGLVAAIIMAAAYAALAGFSIPTTRALVMLLAASLMLLTRRRWSASTLFSVALIAGTLLTPLAVWSASFWLSYAAVGFILLFYSLATDQARLKAPFSRLQRVVRALWTLCGIQFFLFVGLSGLLMAFFGQVSLVAPIVNLIAVPIFSIAVVPLVLIALLSQLLGLSALTTLLLDSASGVLDYLWPWISWTAEWPHAVTSAFAPVVYLTLAVVIAALGCFRMYWRWVCVFGLLCVLWVALTTSLPRRDVFFVTVLDVGQGLSVVVETSHHTLLFDAGSGYGGFSVGTTVVVPYLRSRGHSAIDVMVVSHDDRDHRGGAAGVLSAVPVGQIYRSGRSFDDQDRACSAGQSWNWDGISFRFLSPLPGHRGSRNDRSCVLRISDGVSSVLLTGDIERRAERLLVGRYGGALRSNVMIVPHHGSNTSSSQLLLDVVQPDIAIVSRGASNRFGHPRAAVVRRYEEKRVIWLDTAEQGAILVKVEQGRVNWRPWAGTQIRFWHSHQRGLMR